MLIFCAVISAHASVYLAECWMMVEEKWPKYRTAQTRNPFSVIGIKAVGPYMKYVCSFFMDIQLFGVCVVFLILMSQLFKQIYDQFIPADYHFAFCIWIMILGGILIPLSWLGSPHDLTFIAYGAMGCTIISCFLVLFILLGEAPVKMPYADYTLDTSLKGLGDFALAFGTILVGVWCLSTALLQMLTLMTVGNRPNHTPLLLLVCIWWHLQFSDLSEIDGRLPKVSKSRLRWVRWHATALPANCDIWICNLRYKMR